MCKLFQIQIVDFLFKYTPCHQLGGRGTRGGVRGGGRGGGGGLSRGGGGVSRGDGGGGGGGGGRGGGCGCRVSRDGGGE